MSAGFRLCFVTSLKKHAALIIVEQHAISLGCDSFKQAPCRGFGGRQVGGWRRSRQVAGGKWLEAGGWLGAGEVGGWLELNFWAVAGGRYRAAPARQLNLPWVSLFSFAVRASLQRPL